MGEAVINENKKQNITVRGITYSRYAIKTHVVTNEDDIVDVAVKYASEFLKDGDILFLTEKMVACTQNRAVPMEDIHPRPLAKFLTKFVFKSPHGIGISIPETMEMAIRECGTVRILFAAAISAVGKILGKRGWFYKIAGENVRAIDGPGSYVIPPYNHYVVLGPENPDKVAKKVGQALGCPVLVTDLNDLGGNILGAFPENTDRELMVEILKDNPLGQSCEQTPMGIIRKEE